MPERGSGFVESRGYSRNCGWVGERINKKVQDGCYRGGSDRVFVAVDDAVGVSVAEGVRTAGGATVCAGSRCSWRWRLIDAAGGIRGFQESGSVDWFRETRVGEDFGTLCESWGRLGSSSLEHGFAVGDASGEMARYKNADAIRRARPCLARSNGEGCQGPRTRLKLPLAIPISLRG